MKCKFFPIRQSFPLLIASLVCLAHLPFDGISAEKPGTPDKAEPAAKLPAASEIISKFVQAMGGKEAYLKIESQHAKGKFEMPAQGISGDLEVFHKRPDRLRIKVNIPGVGDILTGFDGKVGWSVNAAMGPMLLDGKQLEQMRDEADFNAVLHDLNNYKSMETIEVTQFDNKQCYKLKLVKKSGQEVTEYYDLKSNLLIGMVMSQESPLGQMVVTNILAEYKKYNDVLFPTKVTQKMGPIEQTMTMASHELNQVDDSAFELPEQIKALVKKP